MKTIFLDTVVHKKKQIVLLKFSYDMALILHTKGLPNVAWTNTHKAWYVNFVPAISESIKAHFYGVAKIDDNLLMSKMDAVKSTRVIINNNLQSETSLIKIEKFRSWLRSKRYAENTIKTYVDALRTFFSFFSFKEVATITNDDIILFNNDYVLKNNLSASFQNQVVNAIKLFYKTIENKKLEIDLIHRPKCEKRLPNVLSKEEVQTILKNTKNIKHKSALSLVYSCGLRRSELLNLKLKHVDSKRNLLLIRNAKGKKDRIAPLSSKIVELLRTYYKSYKPKTYLFEGWKENTKYSERSLEKVLKNSVKLAQLNKPVSLHWLRHSYATHLLENGTDLRYIQEILGHKSSKTTEIYTHVSSKQIANIKTPFDELDL